MDLFSRRRKINVRFSSVEKSVARQIIELKQTADVGKFFVDKLSSKSAIPQKFDGSKISPVLHVDYRRLSSFFDIALLSSNEFFFNNK